MNASKDEWQRALDAGEDPDSPVRINKEWSTVKEIAERHGCSEQAIGKHRREDDAVAIANDSEFGLGGSVWSRGIERTNDVAKRVQLAASG